MKYLVIILLILPGLVIAQSNQKQLGVSTGHSTANSNSIHLLYEWGLKNRNYFGISAGMYGYNDQKAPFTLKAQRGFFYTGLHYKPILSTSRNFAHYAMAGVAIGNHQKKLLYFPQAGLQQVFYTSGLVRIYISEELNYLFGKPKEIISNHWQPFLNAGLLLSLD